MGHDVGQRSAAVRGTARYGGAARQHSMPWDEVDSGAK
jgi:hypothetical protein